jgi:putative NIF3 family GTP cyclohydrolase 1 type 2
MHQLDLVKALNEYFGTTRFNEQDGWLAFMTEVHKAAVKRFYVSEFWDGPWNGLMLDNTPKVDRVYLVVFPTPKIIDTIIAKEVERGAPGSLIFAHHPSTLDEKGVGFVQIPVEQLEELQEHRISYYNCHAPLDCHPTLSTGNALATALGLHDVQRFGPYYGGLAGVYGTVPTISFQSFAERVAKACELPTLRYDQILHNARAVHSVAIVPGGGGDQKFIDEAIALGADTYVTGHWHLFADNPFSISHRDQFRHYVPHLKINLIGAAHYSTEMVVMRDQMKSWFKEHDLEAVLIKQENPWGI